ncbi:MAG: hypothetical protein WC405_10600 [Syntrophales bacterium]
MKRLFYQIGWLMAVLLIITGCGESGKQPPPGPTAKQEAPAPPATGPATPGAPEAVKQQSCYDIGFKTGRCAAKSMSNLPCEPGEDIPMPAECKGKPETEKGLTEGRKSVY